MKIAFHKLVGFCLFLLFLVAVFLYKNTKNVKETEEVKGTAISLDQNNVINAHKTEATSEELLLRDLGSLLEQNYTRIESGSFYWNKDTEIIGLGLNIENITPQEKTNIINYFNKNNFEFTNNRLRKENLVCLIKDTEENFEIRCGKLPQ